MSSCFFSFFPLIYYFETRAAFNNKILNKAAIFSAQNMTFQVKGWASFNNCFRAISAELLKVVNRGVVLIWIQSRGNPTLLAIGIWRYLIILSIEELKSFSIYGQQYRFTRFHTPSYKVSLSLCCWAYEFMFVVVVFLCYIVFV